MALSFRRIRRRGASIASLVAVMMAAGPNLAHAQGGEESASTSSSEAASKGGTIEQFKEHVKKAAQFQKNDQPRAALAEFEAARKIADHPKLAYAVGRIYETLGDCAAARAEFDKGLADQRTRGGLQQKLSEALAQNDACVDRGVLMVECEPQAATLYVDGDKVLCPAELEVAAGEHTLRAEAAGRQTQTATVQVEPAGRVRQGFKLGTPWQKTAVTYTKYGAVGLGGALIIGGVFSDISASSRQDELAQASQSGDLQRTNQLADQADSAQTRTIVLYSLGAVLAAGGAALWVYDSEAESWLAGGQDEPVSAQISAGPDGARVSATLRW